MSTSTRVCLVSASGQNVFFAEILEAFGEALGENGISVERSVDCFPVPQAGLVNLFVPHEFAPLVDELAHPSPAQLARSVALCTEQPGTEWFETSSAIAARAGAVIDINQLGAVEMGRRGVPTLYIPLGYAPSWDHWHGSDRERSIDMAFLGGYTERRASTLARCASPLSGRRAAIYLTETVAPHRAGSPYFLANERKWELMADSKTILNVHRDDLAYFEWHRVIGAILNGCVVLTEHAVGAEPLVPGEHYVSGRREDLPALLGGLLDDPERLSRIRSSAYALVRDELPLRSGIDPLLEQIARLGASGHTPSPDPVGDPVPLPLPPPSRPPLWEMLENHYGEDQAVRMALKHVVVRMQGIERQLAELRGAGTMGDEVATGPRTGVADRQRPAHRPRLCRSRRRGDPERGLGRTARDRVDRGRRCVHRRFGRGRPSGGGGIPVAADHPRPPWAQPRSACCPKPGPLPRQGRSSLHPRRDNQVRPAGLTKLIEALEGRPEAAFAYGLILCFDAAGPRDVLNWVDWEPARLRHGNYIDAMAMIRRSALEEVGGYPLDSTLLGLEDFAVWVAMANAGLDGVKVPDFVARYRRAPHSMLSLSFIESSAALATLLRRYPTLASEDGFGRVLDSEAEPGAVNGGGNAL